MLQLDNKTPFQVGITGFPDQRGIDSLIVTVKATYGLDAEPRIAERQAPITSEDVYWGEPGTSSLKYASEVHLPKPSTDIILVGAAQAPDRTPVTQIDVGLRVGPLRKSIRVFGDRFWTAGLFSAPFSTPEPFETMPLTYERAFGGIHEVDPQKGVVLFEEKNPVGRGFVGKRKRGELAGLPLPNLEDPADLISRPGSCPEPACFSFVASSWLPRKTFAGTYDEVWQTQRAPYLPDDFDPRFFNAAHPGLTAPSYLKGGEPVEAINVRANGRIQCRLPSPDLVASVHIGNQTETPPLNLETVLLEPDEDRLCLLWRGVVACDKKMLKVDLVRVAFR